MGYYTIDHIDQRRLLGRPSKTSLEGLKGHMVSGVWTSSCGKGEEDIIEAVNTVKLKVLVENRLEFYKFSLRSQG